MHRTTPRPATVLLLAAGALVAAGCRAGGEQVAAGGTAAPEATTTTAAPPSSTAAPATAASTTTTRRPPATSTTTPRPTTTSTAVRPRVVAPRQGDQVVAVFVATGPSLADPSFTRAKGRLAALGYRGHSGGDTACSRGAKDALPQLEEYSLSLEFATQADAARFASLYGPVIGTATVTVFCTD